MNIPDENNIAEQLCSLARSGDTAGVKKLLKTGANPNTRDRRQGCPLFHACYGGHTDTVRLLLDAGADVSVKDAAGFTALHWACMSDKPDILALVMERQHAGMDVNERGDAGYTPLHLACSVLSAPAVRLLLEHGADPASPGPRSKAPVDDILICFGRDDDKKAAREQVFEILFEYGADAVLERTLAMGEGSTAREKLLDWYREHHPDLVMERYCSPGPQNPSP